MSRLQPERAGGLEHMPPTAQFVTLCEFRKATALKEISKNVLLNSRGIC
jgi:hypothetical protein